MKGACDPALRLSVPRSWAEVAGAVLMERLGPYAEEAIAPGSGPADTVVLVFYPSVDAMLSDAELLSLLPAELQAEDAVRVERQAVSRDWVDGWKDHFHPVVIGRVRVRPPWEPESGAVDVEISPGLGFGTGLHPTTRGTLTLLQDDCAAGESVTPDKAAGSGAPFGPLVDAGTGSGILAIAAAKLGWEPIFAFDNDPVALVSAHENVAENGVAEVVQVHECGLADAPLSWFTGATVLANMTLDPLLTLVRRLTGVQLRRLVVSGIMSGAQEVQLEAEAKSLGFCSGRRLYEAEWVSLEFFPVDGV